MNCTEWAKRLLLGKKLEDKLFFTKLVYEQSEFLQLEECIVGRDERIQFSQQKNKFPKGQSLKDKKNRGKALHFFANHELQAIEAMSMTILRFPLNSTQLKDLVTTICEEQKHFKLYQGRMKDFDIEFGDYPINDFFWKYFVQVKSFKEFNALMGLTFEAANLDFARFYRDLFIELGDQKTAQILNTVLEDEIKHVTKGLKIFDQDESDMEQVWLNYCESLPSTITPARAKGMIFNREAREQAGMSKELIHKFQDFKDSYPITHRKGWKSL